MLDSLTLQSAETPSKLEVCTAVESILQNIRRSVVDHQCPNNSPSGHHDVEAIGGKAVLCRRFSLGCAHPLTESDPSQLPEDTLSMSLSTLKIAGILSNEQYDVMLRRLGRTDRDLWDIDTNRRLKMQRLAQQLNLRGEETAEITTAFETFRQELDNRSRPKQEVIILERLALIIEMEAAIYTTREKIRELAGEKAALVCA